MSSTTSQEQYYSWNRSDYGNSEHAGRMNRGTLLLLACPFAIITRQTLLLRQHATTVDLSAVDTFAGIDIAIVLTTALVLLLSGAFARTLSSLSRTSAIWLLGYYLFCAASSAWSAASVYTLYRSFEYIVLFLAVFGVVVQLRDFENGERWFLYAAMTTLFLQMFGNLLLMHFSFSLSAWHTNSYSAAAGIIFCYCLGEYLSMNRSQRSEQKKRARRLKFFGAFSLCALALGTSAASNVAAAAGCLVIFLSLRKLSIFAAGLFAALVAFCLASALGGGGEIVRAILFPGKSQAAIETATGRTMLWQMLWRKFLDSPYIGYGFGVISGGRDRAFVALSHNSLFTVLIGTGIVGLFLFLIFALSLWRSAIAGTWRRGRGTVGFTGALAASFLNSLGMPLMADRWWTTSIVFVWLIALFLLYVRGANRPPVEAREEFEAGPHAAAHVGCSAGPSE